MEVQSSRLFQKMVAVLAAAHSLPVDEKEAVREEEHNHHAAAVALEVAQLAVHSLLAVVYREGGQKEQHTLHTHYAAAASAADIAAADKAVVPDSDIPPGNLTTLLPLLQLTRSAAQNTDSSSHLSSHQDSEPALTEDHRFSHSYRQNT
jgi:hypothetical protein